MLRPYKETKINERGYSWLPELPEPPSLLELGL